MKKKILITGSEGFIGSHLTEKLLLTKKYEVKALVLYNSFNSFGWLDTIPMEIKKKIKVITGDIRDPEFVNNIVKGCDYVVNLAALIGIPYSYNATQSYIDTNITGMLNLMNSSRRFKIKRFIQISSSEVYGQSKNFPINENQLTIANSPYAATKIAAEQMCLSYYKSFNFPGVVLRPFNAFGPRQSARAVIPTIVSQLLSNKKKLNLGNINTKRDFNYIDDIVSGIEKTIITNNINGEIINIGSGYEISIKNLIKLITKIKKIRVNVKIEKQRKRPKKSEVNRLLACNKKAKKLLNWKPKFNNLIGLEKALKKTIDWYEEEKNRSFIKTDIYNI
tara:strand:+ start:1767 stop:2771 length:1005 start_codon:yes stop_codon:yes gene_type:complete